MSKLLTKHQEFILITLATEPGIKYPRVQALFAEQFEGCTVSVKQLRCLKEKSESQIETYRTNQYLAFEKALQHGLLKYGNKVSRLLALERVVSMSLEGYTEQTVSRGAVVDLYKKNLPAAVQALKLIKEEISEANANAGGEFVIKVETAEPDES
ncbi:hypothetical protein H6G93_09280 [Nostoc sp. FACHB-973]|nr:hypothetical protein [Nostoc sp. FACHB-973]